MNGKPTHALALLASVLLVHTSPAHAQSGAAATAEAAAEADVAVESSSSFACGPISATWLGGSAEQATFTAGQPLQTTVTSSAAGFLAFQLETATSMRLEAVANGTGDPTLKLFDADGDTLAENDDADGTINSQIMLDLEPGQYCVQVDDLRGMMNTTLRVASADTPPMTGSASLVCGPTTEAQTFGGDGLAKALAAGRPSLQVQPGTYLRFTLEAPASFSLRAAGTGGMDPMMVLFDAEGERLASNDDADGLNSRLDFHPELAAGTYCIGVSAMSRGEGGITVSAEKIDLEAVKQRAFALGQLVPADGEYPVRALAFNTDRSETILQGYAATWFRFEVDAPSLVAISTSGALAGADTELKLFDATGKMLHENDDSENDRNARIAPMLLAKGVYFVALTDRQSSDSIGSPLRPVSISAERYIRAPADK